MTFDTVKPIWSGGTAFIIGGGPSLRGFDFSPLHDRNIIGVNNAFELGPWVDVCWFGDAGWFDVHCRKLDEFNGLKYHCCNRAKARPGTLRIARGKPMGIDTSPDRISWNACSGSSAINLAYHLGARRIVLLGFDMKKAEDGVTNNWHDRHRVMDKEWNPYGRFLKAFPIIAKDAKALDLEILNATPNSALKIFPMVDIKECL